MSPERADTRISICLVASQPMFREGLRLLIESTRDLRVHDDEEDRDADIILLDLSDEDALEILRRPSPAKARFVVLSETSEMDELDPVLRTGVRGIVVKSAHPASLLQAIRCVSQGLKWLDPEIREKLKNPDSILPSQHERWESLSKREREITELVLQGLRYKEIAVSLEISEHTVRNHLRSVFTKLRITSRVELAPYARESVST